MPRSTRLGLVWGFLIVLAATPVAHSQNMDERNRLDLSRFLELQRRSVETPSAALGQRRVEAAAAVKRAPGTDAKRSRLLRYQEQRTPQPDSMRFVANNPVFEELSAGEDVDFAQVIFWNEVALQLTSIDHTPNPPGTSVDNHPLEQYGPARTSRVLAIVHIAVFEAINAVERKYVSYKGIQQTIFNLTSLPANISPSDVSIRHAVALAAHRTLVGLYPMKAGDLNLILAANLAAIQESPNRATAGMAIGDAAAQAILKDRDLDGSELPEPDVSVFKTTDPLKWQRDPLNLSVAIALGANWRYVKPFVIDRADQFRPPNPPPITHPDYVAAFKEVYTLGGDPTAGNPNPPGNADRRPTPTSRSPAQTIVGKFWAYDATALLCAPPRLYNMIATSLALKEKSATFKDALGLARFLALVNIGLADAGIAAWEAKYYYLYPRPVTAIRAATPLTSPIPMASPFWAPLGAPVSNAAAGRLNFTPPFPAYPSGHAVFGGTLFQMFRRYWNDPAGPTFTFVSDEYNGHNSDPGSPTPRPYTPMTFNGFALPEQQNADSRIYLGIHWKFDAVEGIKQGNKVANFVFDNVYKEVAH